MEEARQIASLFSFGPQRIQNLDHMIENSFVEDITIFIIATR